MPEPLESLVIQYGAGAVFGVIGGFLLVLLLSTIAAYKMGVRRGWNMAWEGSDDSANDETDTAAGDVDALLDPDATPIIAMEPIHDAGDSTGPRRSITVPVDGSGGHRASEQTLKRVTADQIEADAKLKPPRASEVAGNPILPEGEVKIRCVACSKKMKASGPKFAKQRRCPFCKIEPFRYITA
jgi:hypothetical protein